MVQAAANHITRLKGNSKGLCHQFLEGTIMKSAKTYILGLSIILMMTAAAPPRIRSSCPCPLGHDQR
jgi:hypothetical protein